MMQFTEEVARGKRFEFGSNWGRFLAVIDDQRIAAAKESLEKMLGAGYLNGKTFLDVGSGSGLFSLAARLLGATVHSFDYDPQCVACTEALKRRYLPGDASWTIEQGSVLDKEYLSHLGTFDVVYAWGVLHHTGAMWEAMGNIVPLVKPRGRLFLSVYNDQGWKSRYWKRIKQIYCKSVLCRPFIVAFYMPRFFILRWVIRRLRDSPSLERGMSLWTDMIDWLGGYPFEVAKPEKVFDFYQARGFQLERLKTCGGGQGNNEFVFIRVADV